MDLETPMAMTGVAGVAGAKCSLREWSEIAGAGWRDWGAAEGFE